MSALRWEIRVMVAVLTLLALPLGAGTEQTVIPPEANWTATAPARGTFTSDALGPRIVMESPQLHETRVERTIETITPINLLILFEADQGSGQRIQFRGTPSHDVTLQRREYARGDGIQS